MHLYNVNGVKLNVEVNGNGPPIVFLHGAFSFFGQAFSEQKVYFSSFRTVIGIDQRGHGHSPDNDQPFSYRQMADDTAALLKQLQLGPTDVVGHSDGGNVGLLLASLHPALVRRLVVSGANFRGDYSGIRSYFRLFYHTSDSGFAATVPAAMRRDYASVAPDGALHWPDMVSKTRDLWLTWNVISKAELGAIGIPVLVMAGDRDTIPLKHTIALYHALAKGQLCILPDTGHATMEDRPAEFNRLTQAFLDQPDP